MISVRNKSPRILSRSSSLSFIPPETDMTCWSIKIIKKFYSRVQSLDKLLSCDKLLRIITLVLLYREHKNIDKLYICAGINSKNGTYELKLNWIDI